MKMIENATQVWHRLWSIRLALLSATFGVAEQVLEFLPYVQGVVPPKVFAALSIACALGAVGARLVKQFKLTPNG